jgi:hypothetical protein
MPLCGLGWPSPSLVGTNAERRVWRFAMKDQWYENLRCLTCGKTGKASLSQDDDDAPTIQILPDGFKVVDTKHGPDFFCGTCDVAVKL